MAQLAFGAIGAAAGFFVGGPVGASIGWSIGAAAGGALFPPKGPHSEGPRITDLRSQVSTYGAPIPIPYGTMAYPGCTIWAADLIEQRIDTEVGGKGGPTATQTDYSYFANFAQSICEGPVVSLLRIWVNGKCFYDVRDESNVEAIVASQNFAQYFTFYNGASDQEPDPTMEAALGVGNVPGYRFRSIIVFNMVPLALFGNFPIGALNIQYEVAHVGEEVTGLRELAAADPVQALGIFPVNATSGVIRNQTLAGTYIYDFDGNFIAAESPTDEESGWPLMVDATAPGSIHVVVRLHDGSIVWADEINNLISLGITRCYAEAGGIDGAVYDLIPFLDPADCFQGIIPCADLRHVMVFTGATSGNADTYYLFRWDGAPVGWTQIQTGAAPDEVAFGAIGSASQGYEVGGILESNLRWIWGVSGIGADALVAIWYVEDDGDIVFVEQLVSNVTGSISHENAICWADGGLCWATFGDGYFYRLFTRNPGNSGDAEDLADIVEDLCLRVGLESYDIDVTDLIGVEVDGFAVSGITASRAAIQHLQRAYWFDAAEIDGQLTFIRRGGASVAEIPSDDLGANDGRSDSSELVQSERTEEDQIPTLVNVAYQAAAADYQPGVQTAQKDATVGDHPTNIELPLSLTDLKAKEIADVLLYDEWMRRNARRFRTTREYAYLTPTDVVTVEDDEATYTVRIEEVRASHGLLEFGCVDEDSAVYEPNSEAGSVEVPNPLTLVGATQLVLLDIPILLTPDEGPGLYAAARGYTGSSWPGARLYMSIDGGGNYSSVGAFSQEAVIGSCVEPLGDWTGGNYIDSINKLRVVLKSGASLQSATVEQLLTGANICAVGSEADGWELVQFKTAELISGTTWEISGLLRGRLGTEWRMDSHDDGESFVLLEQGKIIRVGADLASMGVSRIYKAVTNGALLPFTSGKSFTNAMVCLECYSPVNANATGFGGDIVITWDRRGRLDNGWLDNIDVPLSEATEAYEIDILSDDSPPAVLRTLTSTTDSVTYTAAQQVTDFGSPVPSQILVRIYQMSASVGRGYPLEATLS